MSTKKMFGKSMELEYDERLQQSHCSKTVGTLQTKALQLQQSFVSHHNEHRKDGCCIFQQGRNKQPGVPETVVALQRKASFCNYTTKEQGI
jgi:hypothetical protein